MRTCNAGLNIRLFRPRCSMSTVGDLFVRGGFSRVHRHLRRSVVFFASRIDRRVLVTVVSGVYTYTIHTRGTNISIVRVRNSHLGNYLYSAHVGRHASGFNNDLRGHIHFTHVLAHTVHGTIPSVIVSCGLSVIAPRHNGNNVSRTSTIRFTR